MIEFFVAGAIENPLNGSLSRGHWTRKSRWANEWKARTKAAFLAARGSEPWIVLRAPKAVTFHAQVWTLFDDDGLPACIKPIRDQLIGLAIHSDSPASGHAFAYEQSVNRNRNERGVRVRIAPREEG